MIIHDNADFFEATEIAIARLVAIRDSRRIPTTENLAEIGNVVDALTAHASRCPAVDLRLVDAHRERAKLKLIPGGAER
jgi:hypothetical protein